MKKVFVSGCFDLLHAGHVEFFRRAAKYGDLYVSIGSDQTCRDYKNKDTIYSEQERKFIIENLRCVKKVVIGSGSGVLDFDSEIKKIKPDIFVVNEDSNDTPEKRELVASVGAKYIVLPRTPHEGLPARCATDLRKVLKK